MTRAAASPLTIDQAFEVARRSQSAGDLAEAKRVYGRILSAMPYHAEALTMLASIGYQQGEDLQAEAYLDRAIAIYRSALGQSPGSAAARAPLVNLLLARDRGAEAEQLIRDLNLPVNPIRATPEQFVARRRRGIEHGLPPILINTVPKSASESIWNKLAEGLGLAQGHLSLGLFPDCCLVPARLQAAARGGLIAKEHLPATPHNVTQLASAGLNRVVFHVRDPRQATLSWAHFVHDDVSMRLMGPIWRKIVPPAGVLRGGLTGLIDWSIEHYLPRLIEFMQGWTTLRDQTAPALQVLFLTFEAFRSDPHGYFEQILSFYGIERAAFAADAKAEVVHLRKGETEEWRQVFNAAQQQRAWRLIPGNLAEDFGWVA